MSLANRVAMTEAAGPGPSVRQNGAEVDPGPLTRDGPSEDRAFAVALGRRLRAVREARGLSLQRVEEVTEGEFKASVLGAYERGERMMSVLRLQRLSEAYNVDVEELLPSTVTWIGWEYRLDTPSGDKLFTVGPGWVRAEEPEGGHVLLRLALAGTASMRRKLAMVAEHAKMLETLTAKLDEGPRGRPDVLLTQRARYSNVLIRCAAELGEAVASGWALQEDQELHLQALTAVSHAVCTASRYLPGDRR